jgi:Flp pilus assembly protein TadB/Mg-chelatase subunit ChlD
VSRRLLFAVALCLAGTLPSVGVAAHNPGHAPSGFQLTEAGGAKFPNRAFVISLPTTRTLTADQIQVTESGNAVAGVTLTPASATGNTAFGAVLVVDASESMAGDPIRSAMAAARAFEARRNPNEQLAFLTFNGTTTAVLPFTASATKIGAAFATPPKLAYGTHIYDAVAQAETLLRAAKIEAGSIVLLSDGADTGSTATAVAVTRAARAAHVKLFTIGLQDRHFSPSTLQLLAAKSGGEYTLAKSTAELGPLFDQLGARLSSEYLLRYQSLAGPKRSVNVAVNIPGVGTATSAYETPALPVKALPPVYSPSLKSRFWGSAISMVILALLGAVVVALLVFGLLQPKRSGLPLRMAEFVSVPGLQSRERRPGGAAEVMAEANAEQEPSGVFARLDSVLEIAQIKLTGAQLVLLTIAGTAVVFLLIDLVTGTAWWALLAFVVPLCVRWWVLEWKLKRRRKAFAEQLPDMLQIISGALRSGQSFAGALAVVVDSAAEPTKSEMSRVVAAEQLGVPLDIAMAVVVKRMASRDLEQVALVAELQRAAGGNAAEVIDRVAETVRERFDLRRLIDNLTVQGRMSRWIVSGLPVALVGLISIINPHYLHPLTAHLAGKIMLVFAALLVIAGSLAIKKIVDIEV